MSAVEDFARAELRHAKTSVHGRYLTRAAARLPASGLLLGFHGYGESAQDHLQALANIPGSEHWSFLAMQALHPFYKKNGEVVASWMTKLDRDLAIEDNLEYVRAVLATEGMDLPIVAIGFSQGVAMAYRAAASVVRRPLAVVALAGDVPPELAADDLSRIPRALIGRGTGDDWYDEEKLGKDLERLSAAGVDVKVVRFAGGHEWGAEFLRAAGDFLSRVREEGAAKGRGR